ncbi:MAG: tRNA (adenosine(37)-N6)-dimethylallyltransferase MiaA [Marinilabiliaceae bacterium]|nr:tRNA (adenosine(37)-N6)-dimethylallyltransferase MiaA [Marinilabiliaceae bacterium]
MNKTVVLIVGPTGIGKTDVSLQLADYFKSPIISADSRQIYKEIPIGTAAPTIDELQKVPHFLVATRSISDYYNAYEFEQDALNITKKLFKKHNLIFMVGGSMMYIDAFCNGIDDLPTIDNDLRLNIKEKYENEGIESIRRQLKLLDPDFYHTVDLKNHRRVIHAVEICLMTGKPYSSLRTNPKRERNFNIIKIGLTLNRQELYNRINQRVILMMENGLEQEALSLYEHRTLNALNTVGYKELFDYFDGKYSKEKAVELIQRNTRHYAKKQITWFKRDKDIKWFGADEIRDLIDEIEIFNIS